MFHGVLMVLMVLMVCEMCPEEIITLYHIQEMPAQWVSLTFYQELESCCKIVTVIDVEPPIVTLGVSLTCV